MKVFVVLNTNHHCGARVYHTQRCETVRQDVPGRYIVRVFLDVIKRKTDLHKCTQCQRIEDKKLEAELGKIELARLRRLDLTKSN